LSGDLKQSNSKALLALTLALVILGIWGRFLPHPYNFTPIAAVAIFGGAMLPRRLAIVVPLAAMIVSDLFIGLHSTIFWTWGAFALIALASSSYLRQRLNFSSTAALTLGGSVGFYLLTNFGVWLQGGLYEPTLSGLMRSYINGLPFFRNTLLGDMFYVGALFGTYYLIMAFTRQLSHSKASVSS